MKRNVLGLMLPLLFIASRTHAEVQCDYVIVEDYSVIAGGEEWRHITYGWVCSDTGGNGGTGGTGPGNPPPANPPAPIVRIVSASDENPSQVELRFDYTAGGAPISMTLEKNGQVLSTGTPSSFGLYGSLDNMVYNTILTVTMCNAGGCSDDAVNVNRSTQRLRAEGAISAQWQDYIPIDPYNFTIGFGYESYTRILEVELFYADYSVQTSGPRNGRVKHVQTVDALLWENGKRPPIWITSYQLVPSWAGYQITEDAGQSYGCNLPQNRFPNESAQCTTPSEFGRDGTPGVGKIQSVIASGSANGVAYAAFGALELTIWP